LVEVSGDFDFEARPPGEDLLSKYFKFLRLPLLCGMSTLSEQQYEEEV
jgi:hypothetical protein